MNTPWSYPLWIYSSSRPRRYHEPPLTFHEPQLVRNNFSLLVLHFRRQCRRRYKRQQLRKWKREQGLTKYHRCIRELLVEIAGICPDVTRVINQYVTVPGDSIHH